MTGEEFKILFLKFETECYNDWINIKDPSLRKEERLKSFKRFLQKNA